MAKPQKKKPKASTSEREFLYRDIATKLRDRIASGVYAPNVKLPSLNDLVDEFGVSAISVRRALRELNYEGLIYGEQGRGVFVKAKGFIHRVLAATTDRSIGDEIARAGFTPRIKELGFEKIKADEEVAQRLNVKAGTTIFRHGKLALADQEPVSLHFLYFTGKVAEQIKKNIGAMFVFRLLESANIKVHESRFEFSVAGLSAAHAEIFKLPVGFPTGIIHFTPMTRSREPILTGLTIYRSDRFVFEFNVPH